LGSTNFLLFILFSPKLFFAFDSIKRMKNENR